MMTSRDDGQRKAEILSEHGQHCAALLVNMMMSIGYSTPSTAHPLSDVGSSNRDNAMSLDLGLPSGTETVHVGRVLKNNGFGEITGSPSLSPTASHASTKASFSIEAEQDHDSASLKKVSP